MAGESWVYQGRQSHGWFGTGTAPKDDDPAGRQAPDGLFDPANTSQRAAYVAASIIGQVSRADRSRWIAALPDTLADDLGTAATAWNGAARVSRDAFRARFLLPGTSDETVDRLRRAAWGIVDGRTPDALAKAGEDLAAVAQGVGPYGWARYVAALRERAVSVASPGAAPGVVLVKDGGGAPAAAAGAFDPTPVPFVDDKGVPVLDSDGTPMLRPAGLPPGFFVSRGLKAKDEAEAMIAQDGVSGSFAALGYYYGDLSNFKRGHVWDAQRVNGVNKHDYVSYATVAIGLYAAAAGTAPMKYCISTTNTQELVSSAKTQNSVPSTQTYRTRM